MTETLLVAHSSTRLREYTTVDLSIKSKAHFHLRLPSGTLRLILLGDKDYRVDLCLLVAMSLFRYDVLDKIHRRCAPESLVGAVATGLPLSLVACQFARLSPRLRFTLACHIPASGSLGT